ncbi:MAG TPA: hypothetical protein VLY83_02910 [Methanoregula sp.]|nr:hypothetical protein [Methanoregula sp.]
MRRGQMFLFYLLCTAGLISSIFLLGSTVLFSEGMMMVGLILLTNVVIAVMHLHS